MSGSSPDSTNRSTDDPQDFAALLAAARRGSGVAVGELMARCRPYLMLVANKELDPQIRAKLGASDVVQETLITVQQNLNDFRGQCEDELLAWMRGILTNDLLDAHRRYRQTSKRQVDREVRLATDSQDSRPDLELKGPDRTPGAALVVEEEIEALRVAMQRLPEDYQMVLRLRNWQQLSFADIAERMDRSSEAVRKLWTRALQRLQAELGKDDGRTGPSTT